MRLPLASLCFVTFSAAAACGGSPDRSPTPYEDGSYAAAPLPPSKADPDRPSLAAPAAPAPDDGSFSEVVYVFMRDRRNQGWFCTGTLVAADRVVTAAHCLDAMFVSYEIVAPLAPSRPRVRALAPAVVSTGVEDVANPDIGFLTLEKPIALGHYATLTDVGPRVDAGEALSAAAVVRTDELPEAPLEASGAMPLTSTVEFGYEHGFGTPLFTKGGDSGAGLFLVENGAITHKLIGVARQPEPARSLDHFTRVDASFLGWYGEKTGAGR
ncbi:hypothetical protein BH11MYX4_BH11MYX4_43310 [soil metagenome]